MTSSPSAAAAAASSSPHLHITIANPASSTISTITKSHSHHNNQQPSPRPQHSGSVVSPRSSGGTAVSGGGGGTNQACAACKYQRRKCNPDCPLAPYFPADQQRRFLNAHRLFGVSNILKTLRRLKPELCDEAMNSLIFQAEMRAADPVGGCWHIIRGLERQLELASAELNTVLHHLSLCRQAAAGVDALPADDVMDGPCVDLEVTSNQQPLLLGADQQEVVDTLYVNQDADATGILHGGHHDQDGSPQDHGGNHQQQQLYDYFYYETTSAGAEDPSSKTGVDINVDIMQHFDYDSSCDADHKVEEMAPPVMSSPGALGQQLDEDYQIDQKEYEMKVASLVDVFARHELLVVDMNADIDVKEELQKEDAKNNHGAVAEAAQISESSHCRLGLGFSSL